MIINLLIFTLLPSVVFQQVYWFQNNNDDNGVESVQSTFWKFFYLQQYRNMHSHPHQHDNLVSPAVSKPPVSREGRKQQQDGNHQKFTKVIAEAGCEMEEAIDYVGLASWLGFCLCVLVVGVWAGCRRTRRERDQEWSQEQLMLAGRDIHTAVGVLTMAATWVGGGFIIGAAQGVYTRGLVWTHAPVFYSLSLVVGGAVFAKKMRDAKYFTMIDPFTQKYGRWGSVLVIPAAISEIIWCAAILSSLGSTIFIILRVEDTYSIYISALLSLSYTLCGGLVSVAYTDVVQILFVIFGLVLALPFSMSHPAVSNIFAETAANSTAAAAGSVDWVGRVERHQWGAWVDTCLLCLLGGVPWQSYFQRVLSAQTGTR